MSDVHEIRLPDHLAEAFGMLLDEAEQREIRILHYHHMPGMKDFVFTLGVQGQRIGALPAEPEHPVRRLRNAGLLRQMEASQPPGVNVGYVELDDLAFRWREYQKRGKVGRWVWGRRAAWRRMGKALPDGVKWWLTAISLLVGILCGIIKIRQELGYLP